MQIGVGLNAVIPGASGADVLAWARRAEAGGLSTVGIIDRMTYVGHESLTTLAAVAGATDRIRLMTTVLVAPQRNPGVLVKQALTLASLSGGRLSLGIGIGSRPSDYRVAGAGVAFGERAARVEDQLDRLRRSRSGAGDAGEVSGPRPGGYELLYGGYSEPAARRAGRTADGFLAGNLPPGRARELYAVAEEARRAAGRDERLRFVLCGYWCLGPSRDQERGRAYLRDYYAFAGEERVQRTLASVLATPSDLRDRFDACERVGVDEVVLWPTVADPVQLHRYLEVVAARS